MDAYPCVGEPTFTARCGSVALLVGTVARMPRALGPVTGPANLPNLPLCIILRSDAHWLSLGGPYPSSGMAIVASQKAGLSLLFIGEDSPSTLIIDKVAISTRSVLAISSSDADQKPAQTPGGFWVNPERGAVAELALQWLNFLRSCSVSAEARRAPPLCS